MDSSYYNSNHGQWHRPFSPRPPSSVPAVPLPHPQSYPENPNFQIRQSHSAAHHHYSLRREPPPPTPPPVVTQPPPYYYSNPPPPPPPAQPPQHFRYNSSPSTYDSPRISNPYLSYSCTEPQSVSRSAWVEYKNTRSDSWDTATADGPDRNYQFDYDRLSRGFSSDNINHGLDGNSRFRDELRSLECKGQIFGLSRIEETHQGRGQLKSESGRSSRYLGAGNRDWPSGFCNGDDRYGASIDSGMIRSSASNGGSGNQRSAMDSEVHSGGRALFSQQDDYYHSEIERQFDHGRRESSNELSRTPKKQMQKKSVLLRIETPRTDQKGRENDRSRHPNYYNENRPNSFRGKHHSGHFDRGLVEKQRGRTPPKLDVSFKSNVLVAKAIVSPSTTGVNSGVALTPRASKVRRVSNKDKKDSDTAKVDIKASVREKTPGSEGFKLSARKISFSEKESDSHLIPPSIVFKDKTNKERPPKDVLFDYTETTIDTDLEAPVDDIATKVCSAVCSSKRVSSLDKALKQSEDKVDEEHGCNLRSYSSRENASDVDKNLTKSHLLLPRAVTKNINAKKMMKRVDESPITSTVSQTAACDIEKSHECSEGGVPCEDGVSKNCMMSVSSRDLQMTDKDILLEGRKSPSPPSGAMGYVENDLDKSSVEATISLDFKNDSVQLLAKSDMPRMDGIEDGSERMSQKGDSLSPEYGLSREFSAGDVNGTSVLEVNDVSRGTTKANSDTFVSNTVSKVDSPNLAIVSQSGGRDFENGVNPSVGSVISKGSIETRAFKKAEDTYTTLGSDAGKQACVNDISSSPKSVTERGSLDVFPVGRAMSTEMCTEYVSGDDFRANQDTDLGSHHPAEDSHTDRCSILDSSCQKAGLREVSLGQEVKEHIHRSCDIFPSSPALEHINKSGNDTSSDSEAAALLCEPGLSIGQVKSETLLAGTVDENSNIAESENENMVLDGLQELLTIFQESIHPDRYMEHHPCSGQISTEESKDGSMENPHAADISEVEVALFDGKASGDESLVESDVPSSKPLSHTDVECLFGDSKDQLVSLPRKGITPDNASGQQRCPRSSSTFAGIKNLNPPPTRITKANTWHRKSDASASSVAASKPLPSTFSTQQKLPKASVQVSSTYVRKGNSLLRKPLNSAPSGAPLAVDEDKKVESVGRSNADETSIPERQPLPITSNVVATSSGKCSLSSAVDPNGSHEFVMDFAVSGAADVPHPTTSHLNCEKKQIPATSSSSNPRKMLYVKKKSNQLVAASDRDSKSQICSSDDYFKRSKNQLVRTSDSHVKQPIDAVDPQAEAAPRLVSKRSFSSKFSDSAVTKAFKHSKFSLVWTLNDTKSGKTNRGHMQCQRILPQLVPWKRVTYWRRRLMNSASVLRNGSFSTIGRKLSLLRNRHTVYTRSTNGFSLRKSKVLSIGGSHLKWSKSIERDSKKANEEATLAVAAFGKTTLGENQSEQGTNRTRERIFRVGSIRYKMDSSGRTLHRMSDDEPPSSGPPESEKGVKKKSFIPTRLVIGNGEYVRVGNGNQLVRDPKKRSRVLANEKVRWSLHNVRLRLAKKKKYCQFFTRFGKCNKDDGKCPFIHDPSKIAVCTKFLNGLCSDPNCRLTHKVIPERMPDCSYFLQGLCSNEDCPYRHVHVNKNAPICEGFLKGYCSDGNECQKKHTNTCPVYEATGCCLQGDKCKLHHPKNRSRGRKRKGGGGSEAPQRNTRGRYFGSVHHYESEPVSLLNGAASRGEASEYISIDVSEDDEAVETVRSGSGSLDDNGRNSLYKLIRPVGLMQL